ncbi:MAG: hypothetical protein J3K34DRAFT_477825 [Monoraphidium minutum]|nr:MAG: hypothetical protein J3K34DRAFT_477825 [Monoraphidium minutum]
MEQWRRQGSITLVLIMAVYLAAEQAAAAVKCHDFTHDLKPDNPGGGCSWVDISQNSLAWVSKDAKGNEVTAKIVWTTRQGLDKDGGMLADKDDVSNDHVWNKVMAGTSAGFVLTENIPNGPEQCSGSLVVTPCEPECSSLDSLQVWYPQCKPNFVPWIPSPENSTRGFERFFDPTKVGQQANGYKFKVSKLDGSPALPGNLYFYDTDDTPFSEPPGKYYLQGAVRHSGIDSKLTGKCMIQVVDVTPDLGTKARTIPWYTGPSIDGKGCFYRNDPGETTSCIPLSKVAAKPDGVCASVELAMHSCQLPSNRMTSAGKRRRINPCRLDHARDGPRACLNWKSVRGGSPSHVRQLTAWHLWQCSLTSCCLDARHLASISHSLFTLVRSFARLCSSDMI